MICEWGKLCVFKLDAVSLECNCSKRYLVEQKIFFRPLEENKDISKTTARVKKKAFVIFWALFQEPVQSHNQFFRFFFSYTGVGQAQSLFHVFREVLPAVEEITFHHKSFHEIRQVCPVPDACHDFFQDIELFLVPFRRIVVVGVHDDRRVCDTRIFHFRKSFFYRSEVVVRSVAASPEYAVTEGIARGLVYIVPHDVYALVRSGFDGIDHRADIPGSRILHTHREIESRCHFAVVLILRAPCAYREIGIDIPDVPDELRMQEFVGERQTVFLYDIHSDPSRVFHSLRQIGFFSRDGVLETLPSCDCPGLSGIEPHDDLDPVLGLAL